MPGEYKDLPNGIQVGVNTVWVTNDFTPAHPALDLTPAVFIKTPEKARVAMLYATPQGGNTVELEHGQGFTTVYKHLVSGSVVGRVGDVIEKGITFAKAGNTGVVTGPHIHYEVRINGVPQDPLPYLLGKLPIPAYIISETNLAVKAITPMFKSLVSSRVRLAGGLSAPILVETTVGQEFAYLGKTKLIDGYEWARIDVNGVIGYIALNPTWNTIINPAPVTVTVEVYKPFEASFDRDGMNCTLSFKPIKK